MDSSAPLAGDQQWFGNFLSVWCLWDVPATMAEQIITFLHTPNQPQINPGDNMENVSAALTQRTVYTPDM